MERPLADFYRGRIWDLYARAVSAVTIIVLVVACVLGGFDLLKFAFPGFTLNSSMHEKYQSNDAYTDFGTFRKELSDRQITLERTANYEKLLRMEQRDAAQRLVKIAFALAAVAVLNVILVFTGRRRRFDEA